MTFSVFRSLRRGLVTITLLTAIIPAIAQQRGSTSESHGYKPKDGFVPDSQTAVKIAKAVLIPVYGEKQIRSEEPFTAQLKGDVWTVAGTLRCPDGRGGFATTTDCDGGVAVIKLSKADGRVLFTMHYK
jgi:NTF2 fold immunity protein